MTPPPVSSAPRPQLLPRDAVVSPVPAERLAALALTAEEGFLVSRVDRPMRVDDLVRASGLEGRRVLALATALVEKGALVAQGDLPPSASTGRYGDFVFSPAELAAAPEVDLDRRKEILFLFHHLDTLSHYRLLEVSPLAGAEEVQRAWAVRSRMFHPDAYFRQQLGLIRPMLERIFQRLGLARDTLVDDAARATYEREHRAMFTPEEQAAIARREAQRIDEAQRARDRRRRLARAPGLRRLSEARQLLAQGEAALDRGELAAATLAFHRAAELDPRLEEAATRLAEVRRVGKARSAAAALEEAEGARLLGQSAKAADLCRRAVELDPQSAPARIALARLLLAAQEPREARLHAQKAAELGEASAAFRLLFGEILLRCGMRLAARRELERAAEGGEKARARVLLKEC